METHKFFKHAQAFLHRHTKKLLNFPLTRFYNLSINGIDFILRSIISRLGTVMVLVKPIALLVALRL